MIVKACWSSLTRRATPEEKHGSRAPSFEDGRESGGGSAGGSREIERETRDRRRIGTNLVARLTAWPECLRKVSDAKQLPVLDAVDQVDQQLLAHGADEARGMEEVDCFVVGKLVCPHTHVLLINLSRALSAQDRLATQERRRQRDG